MQHQTNNAAPAGEPAAETAGETRRPGLVKLADCQLGEGDYFAAVMLRGWCALDTHTGAFLSPTRGRGKGGLGKYVLILPTKTPAARGGLLASYDWNLEDRKFIRAWSDAEAIEAANIKLARMLAKRAKGGQS